MNEGNTNAKILGVATLLLGAGAIYALFFHDWDKENKSLNGAEVLLFKIPKVKDFKKGKAVVYKDVNGEFTKIGKVEFVSKGLINVGGSVYEPNELRLLKKK